MNQNILGFPCKIWFTHLLQSFHFIPLDIPFEVLCQANRNLPHASTFCMHIYGMTSLAFFNEPHEVTSLAGILLNGWSFGYTYGRIWAWSFGISLYTCSFTTSYYHLTKITLTTLLCIWPLLPRPYRPSSPLMPSPPLLSPYSPQPSYLILLLGGICGCSSSSSSGGGI